MIVVGIFTIAGFVLGVVLVHTQLWLHRPPGHQHRWAWLTWRTGRGPTHAYGRCACGAHISEVRRS